jgi:hypothetical protein
MTPHAEKDPNGALRWALEAREAVEEFNGLRWECTIGQGEYIVLGTQANRRNTLGGTFFVPEGEPPRTQWLLVLRASRVLFHLPVDESLTQAPPLAMQATWGQTRGGSR